MSSSSTFSGTPEHTDDSSPRPQIQSLSTNKRESPRSRKTPEKDNSSTSSPSRSPMRSRLDTNDTLSTSKSSLSSSFPSIQPRHVVFVFLVVASVIRLQEDWSPYINAVRRTWSDAFSSGMYPNQATQQASAINGTNLTGNERQELIIRQTSTVVPAASDKVITNTVTEPSIQQTPFVFPDLDFRTKYYMGSWHNRNLSTALLDCSHFGNYIDFKWSSVLHDKDVLYTHDGLALQVNTVDHWNIGNYLKFYLQILRNSTIPSSAIVAMCVGDSSSNHQQLPVAAKTRKAGFMSSSAPKDNNSYYPIVWPLNMERHFGPVNEYQNEWNAGNVTKWEDKKVAMIWRGGFTGVPALMKGKGFRSRTQPYGPRVQAVLANCVSNHSQIDIAFINMPKIRNGVPQSVAQTLRECGIRQTHITMLQQLQFKYILNVEGNDVSSGLKWQLASNSVVFMSKPETISFAMEDQLIPFVHYIPVNANYTNLEEMMEWAKTNDDKAKKIAEQSTQYMHDLWISDKAQQEYQQLQVNLAQRYQAQFASALWTCLPPSKRKPVNLRR